MIKKVSFLVLSLLPALVFSLPSTCPQPGSDLRFENRQWIIPAGWSVDFQDSTPGASVQSTTVLLTSAIYNPVQLAAQYPNSIECLYQETDTNIFGNKFHGGDLGIIYTGEPSPFNTPPSGGLWMATGETNGFEGAVCFQFAGGPVSNCPFPTT